MIKKIFKIAFKGLVALVILTALLYGGFHLYEYATGGKFVAYLEENSETVKLDETFSFNQINQDINENNLVLVGEIHGFEEPQKLDYELFTHLNAQFKVRQYYAEVDFVQAIYLNKYLSSGDEKFLEAALRKWAVIQGRNNKDYFDKYRKFHNYYKSLSKEDKFTVVGIDKISDMELVSAFLESLSPIAKQLDGNSSEIDALVDKLDVLDTAFMHSPDTLFLLSHIRKNLTYVEDRLNRESVMFENFYSLYSKLNTKENKAYGFFGLFHVFQYGVNGQQPLAAQIRTSDLGLEKSILSLNFLMVDSYMIMPSAELPEFMRDDGLYTKMPISADVLLFMYIYGIKDLKRMTPENHKSLIKMNGSNSPYVNTSRMTKTIQILPVADKFEFDEKGKPYVQYTLFVRNSDWAEPMLN